MMVLAVLAAGAFSITRTQATTVSAGAVYEWRFDSGANPAAPEVSAGGIAQAAISPGEFSDGWIAQAKILGAAQGIWDLGKSGTIALSLPADAVGASGLVTVKVVQYYDQGGTLYSELATVSVPGAETVNINSAVTAATTMGGWFTDETQFRAAAGATVNSVLITGASGGSLIDSVVVEPSLTVVPPPILSIQPAGPDNSQVNISWPAANYSTMVLESTTDLNDPNGWTPVQQAVQTTGDTSSVTLDVAGGRAFTGSDNLDRRTICRAAAVATRGTTASFYGPS